MHRFIKVVAPVLFQMQSSALSDGCPSSDGRCEKDYPHTELRRSEKSYRRCDSETQRKRVKDPGCLKMNTKSTQLSSAKDPELMLHYISS